MSADKKMENFNRFWKQTRLPVIFQRKRPAPLLIRLPYAADNKTWLRNNEKNKPSWDKLNGAWEVPQAWLERAIRLSFSRYGACYVIQLYKEKEVCAPACWNALGADCEFSCMGANHSTGRPNGRWYEISDTFAVLWGVQRYSVRLLTSPNPALNPTRIPQTT